MSVWDEVQRARAAAHAKHGDNSIEAVPGGDPRWLSILVEEVGEVAHEQTYDSTGDLRAELVDVLAVASAWVDAIDRADGDAGARPRNTPLIRTEHPGGLKVVSYGPDEVLMRWNDGESKLVEMAVVRSIVAAHEVA